MQKQGKINISPAFAFNINFFLYPLYLKHSTNIINKNIPTDKKYTI